MNRQQEIRHLRNNVNQWPRIREYLEKELSKGDDPAIRRLIMECDAEQKEREIELKRLEAI